MLIKTIISALLFISLIACTGKQDSYIGYYKESSKKSHTRLKALRISKIYDAYYADGYGTILWDNRELIFKYNNTKFILSKNKQQVIVIKNDVVEGTYNKIN